MLDPRSSHEKKFENHKITTRKILNPRRHDGTMARWHETHETQDDTGPTEFSTLTNIYILKTELVSHKQYLFSLLTLRNVKKTLTDQILFTWFFTGFKQDFLLCLKRKDPQTFKSSICKNLCFCYWFKLLL